MDGVKRPMADGNEGSTPALGDAQTRRLLEAPPPDTLKGVRDRAILAILLYHGVRRESVASVFLADLFDYDQLCGNEFIALAGPSLHIEYKNFDLKQYFKEGRGCRTEGTFRNPNDFGVNKGLTNLPYLQNWDARKEWRSGPPSSLENPDDPPASTGSTAFAGTPQRREAHKQCFS